MVEKDTMLYFLFCQKLADKTLDDFFDVMRPNSKSPKEHATLFVAFCEMLLHEYCKKMQLFSPNICELVKSEMNRFEDL